MLVTLDLPIRIGVLEFEGIRIDDGHEAFDGLTACAARHRADAIARGTSTPGAVPGVGHARVLFHTLGIDATRRRPSSEALLNRALKDKPLPRVNTLVDVGNWCSLDFLLPLGVYDRDKLRGTIALRAGRPGEAYEAIGDKVVNLAGRFLLADDDGPFGSPMTDSRRTCVSAATQNALVLIYAPSDYDFGRLDTQARVFAERVERCCGGRTARISLVEG